MALHRITSVTIYRQVYLATLDRSYNYMWTLQYHKSNYIGLLSLSHGAKLKVSAFNLNSEPGRSIEFNRKAAARESGSKLEAAQIHKPASMANDLYLTIFCFQEHNITL